MTLITSQMVAVLDPQWREFWSERSAILEFDCKLPREEAESLAFRETTSALLKSRISKMAHHQAEQPKPLHVPTHEPVITGKELAGGVAA